ncbi:MAG: DUF362 domain-containing protein [Candidatus Hydrothermarchaeaceae archaeon]
MVKVCILKSEQPSVRRALDLIDFTPGDCELVVIKPDLCNSSFKEEITDPGLIEQVLKIYEGHARCAVVGNGGQGVEAGECFERTGVSELCERYDSYTVNLGKDVRIPVERDYLVLKNFKMPTAILKADVFINMPKMKTSQTTAVSLGLMNLFDIIPRKAVYYPRITESICDLMNIRSPDVNIMDGVVCMEGSGPRRRPKRMDLVLASRDTVALDTIACRVMGISPVNVEHIFRAGYSGLGEYTEKNIKVVGRPVDDARDKFEH